MQVIHTVAEFKAARGQMAGSLGVVPTMGYLHDGHLSLVRRAAAENDATAVSIFVNPTQFGPNEDFTRYPRDEERDLRLLRVAGVGLVFMPAPAEMYPSGATTWVEVLGVSEVLEGAHRPGHFRGVATVVAKLFNIMQPTRAYFGQKDAQQVVVIRKMAADLNMNLEVVACPTVRETDGLAMSSRNVYLNAEERKAASVLHASLALARTLWKSGERDASRIRAQMMQLISSETSMARVDYVSIADPRTLMELAAISDGALVSLAVGFGATRLIDNIVLGE